MEIQEISKDQAKEDFYKASEEQDTYIARGIKLVCTKLLDLVTLASFNNLDLDAERRFSLMRN